MGNKFYSGPSITKPDTWLHLSLSLDCWSTSEDLEERHSQNWSCHEMSLKDLFFFFSMTKHLL